MWTWNDKNMTKKSNKNVNLEQHKLLLRAWSIKNVIEKSNKNVSKKSNKNTRLENIKTMSLEE
jgi:hypothetical protein